MFLRNQTQIGRIIFFLSKLVFYYNKNIPLVKKKSRKKKKHPWITKGIMHSIKQRNKLYKIAITTQNTIDLNNYKKYRNQLNSLIRLSRKMYYSQQCENNKDNPNGLWETIKDLTGKNNKDSTFVFHHNNE